jgi:hypothetical protein
VAEVFETIRQILMFIDKEDCKQYPIGSHNCQVNVLNSTYNFDAYNSTYNYSSYTYNSTDYPFYNYSTHLYNTTDTDTDEYAYKITRFSTFPFNVTNFSPLAISCCRKLFNDQVF